MQARVQLAKIQQMIGFVVKHSCQIIETSTTNYRTVGVSYVSRAIALEGGFGVCVG